jgi:hypothetical protein
VVETNPATNITMESATLNGKIVNNGGKIDEYGFIFWSSDPAKSQKFIVDKNNHTGLFSKKLDYLPAGTYYYKAYATNAKGTAEGQVYSLIYSDIKVLFNNKNLSFDVPPFIENSRTMVPLRAIFEALGAEVKWDGDTKTVTAKKNGTEIKLVIDGAAYKNGELMELDTPAKIINNRTVVPLRFVAESFECQVTWDGDTRTVIITQ